MYFRLPLVFGLAICMLTVSAGHKHKEHNHQHQQEEDDTYDSGDAEFAMCNDIPYDSDTYNCLEGM
jgi:hypothetical protein